VVEGLPKKERERMLDLARFAQDVDEQRYWEVYWMRSNLLPAAVRTFLSKDSFKRWKKRKRETDVRSYTPEATLELQPHEDEKHWMSGPEEWIEYEIRKEIGNNPEVSTWILEKNSKRAEEALREIIEGGQGRAARIIFRKFFGKRVDNEEYRKTLRELLKNSMYGRDLAIATQHWAAGKLLKLIEEFEKEKDDVRKTKLIEDMNEVDLRREKIESELGNTKHDPLQIRGDEESIFTNMLAKAGPAALVDGTGIVYPLVYEQIMNDRRIYKKRAVLAGILSALVQGVVKAVTGRGKGAKGVAKGELKAKAVFGQDAYTLAAKYLLQELGRISEEKKGDITKQDLEKAGKRAKQRLVATLMLNSVQTPEIAAGALIKALKEFVEDYYRKTGKVPVIRDLNDAKEVLTNVQKIAKREIRRGPNYWLKGFVLAHMGENKNKV
jgi:hypothetical protein